MKAVDTNILVYAHREDNPFHDEAGHLLEQLANGSKPWCIPWPCVHEFISIATHPKIYNPPSTIDQALSFLEHWFQSPVLQLAGEGSTHFQTLSTLAKAGKVRGPKIHDAKIAAICLGHGVDTLYSADRDFSLFPALQTRNPLVQRTKKSGG